MSDLAIVEASFIHTLLVEIDEGHSWADMLHEIAATISDEQDGTDATKKYDFWIGEARELSATDGIGWPGVLRLVGEAMRKDAEETT